MGLTGMVFSIIAAAIGAVMYYAITAQGSGFRLSTIGVILMIIGVIGFIASSVVFGISRKSTNRHSFDRTTTNGQGISQEIHEETR